MNKRAIGNFYEDLACDYLRENGILILQRNFRCKAGELDIIGRDNTTTVVFEVKFRQTDDFGGALHAVDFKKQKKICKCALIYCMLHPEISELRYDVIAISKTKIDWIKNAFDHIGYRVY